MRHLARRNLTKMAAARTKPPNRSKMAAEKLTTTTRRSRRKKKGLRRKMKISQRQQIVAKTLNLGILTKKKKQNKECKEQKKERGLFSFYFVKA
ncbi:hypothetical protein X975_09696, partial [Stegodyphus mimosarum]